MTCPECGMVVELEEAQPQAVWMAQVFGRVWRCAKCDMPVSTDTAMRLAAADAPMGGGHFTVAHGGVVIADTEDAE